MSRYDNRILFNNRLEQYKSTFDERGVKQIRHYSLGSLKHPTAKQIRNLELIDHVWSLNDKYFKLAHEYYSDSKFWWIIAWFNQKPTESDLELGDVIQIPLPLDKVLSYMEL